MPVKLPNPLDSEASVASALNMVEAIPLSLLAQTLPEETAGDGYWDQQVPNAIIQKALFSRQRHPLQPSDQAASLPIHTSSGRLSRPPKLPSEAEPSSSNPGQPKMDFVLHVKVPAKQAALAAQDQRGFQSGEQQGGLALQISVSHMDIRGASKRLRDDEDVKEEQQLQPTPKRQCIAVAEVIPGVAWIT